MVTMTSDPQPKPETPLQHPLTRAPEDHVIPTLRGAVAKAQGSLRAQPQGRRSPDGSRTLQSSANRQGSPGLQKEVCHLRGVGAAWEG